MPSLASDSTQEILEDEEDNDNLFLNNMNELMNDNYIFVNEIRNRIYNRDSVYFNQQTFNIDNDLAGTITNIANNFLGIPIRTPLNLSKIITELNENEIENDYECPICYENLNKLENQFEDNKPVKIICDHKFCHKCICKWFRKHDDCPICKKNMRECIVVNNQNIQQNIDGNITDNTLDNINEYNGLPIDEVDTEIDID